MIKIRKRLRKKAQSSSLPEVFMEISDSCHLVRFKTGVFVSPKDFDEEKGYLCDSFRNIAARHRFYRLETVLMTLKKECESGKIIFTPLELKKRYSQLLAKPSLFKLFEKNIREKRKIGKTATADAYQATYSCLSRLLNNRDITLEHITKNKVELWQELLLAKGLSHNTLVFYLRNLRTILLTAPNSSKFRKIFDNISFKQQKTEKRALSLKDMELLLCAEVSSYERLQYAKDLFTLSFLLRGMPMIDLAYLGKSCLSDEVIAYRRHKTGTLLRVRVLPEAKRLIKRYESSKSSPYLLNILKEKSNLEDSFREYRSFLRKYNKSLYDLGVYAGLRIRLSSYVSRHTWATQAKETGASISLISESLGHSSEKVTYSYLKEFDLSALNQLNSEVCSRYF